MLYSGTTQDFHKNVSKLPELVQKRLAGYWAEWRELSSKGSRHHAKPAHLEEEFTNLADRMALKETQIGDGIYRCDIGLGYRALGAKIRDASEKQRIVWFWAGSHADYDKLLKNGNDRKLIKTAASAGESHLEKHASWRRVRIKLPASLQAVHAPRLYPLRPGQGKAQITAAPAVR